MRPRILLPSLLLLALFSVAHAENQRTWNFLNGNTPFRADVYHLTEARPTAEGLWIRTDEDGYVLWNPHPIDGPVDVVTLRVRSARPTEAVWLWETAEGLRQAFFTISASDAAQEIDVVVSNFKKWQWKTRAAGIGFPAGADVVIERMTFRRWGAFARMEETWKTFWTFDTFRPYSINFLWGPLLAFNPIARRDLFDTLPPFGWSAMRLIYLLLLLGIGTGLAVRFFFARTVRGIRIGWMLAGGTVVFCWLLLDLRMGLELLGYAKSDLTRYVFAAEEQKTLRTHEDFYAFAKQALPFIRQQDRFAVILPATSPFFGNLRYMAYPSVPVPEGQDRTGVRLWIVIDRPDVALNDRALVKTDKKTGETQTLFTNGSAALRMGTYFIYLSDE